MLADANPTLLFCPQQESETGNQAGELSYNNPSLTWPGSSVSKPKRVRTQPGSLPQTRQLILLNVRKHPYPSEKS